MEAWIEERSVVLVPLEQRMMSILTNALLILSVAVEPVCRCSIEPACLHFFLSHMVE